MFSRSIPRLLLVGLTLVLIAIGLVTAPAARAAGNRAWTDQVSREDVLVQGCTGFEITSSYAADRIHHQITAPDSDEVFERQQVSFTGAIGNATTGKSYAYDGNYTRIDDYDQGTASISDLLVRVEMYTSGTITFEFARVEFDLGDSPPNVVQALVSNVMQMDLCSLLDGPANSVIQTASPIHPLESISCDVQPRIGFTC